MVCKVPHFGAKHPEVIKNPFYILAPEGSQKKVSAHGLYNLRNNHTFRTYNAELCNMGLKYCYLWDPKYGLFFLLIETIQRR